MWRFPDRRYFTVPGNPLFLMMPTADAPARRHTGEGHNRHASTTCCGCVGLDASWTRTNGCCAKDPFCVPIPALTHHAGDRRSPPYTSGGPGLVTCGALLWSPGIMAPVPLNHQIYCFPCTFNDVRFTPCSANRGEGSADEQGYVAIGGTVEKNQQRNRGTQSAGEPW